MGGRLALFAAAAAVLAPAAIAGRAAVDPTVAVVDQRPVVVRGAHFLPRERVVVVFAAGAALRADPPRWRYRRVAADAQGRFVVRYLDVVIPRCTTYRTQARGHLGSRASFQRTVRCAPG